MSDIYIEIEDNSIEVNMEAAAISPAPTAENDFLIGSSALAWVRKTLAQVKTILGLKSAAYTESTDYAAVSHTHSQGQVTALPFQTVDFAKPLTLDGTTNKDFICTLTGDTTVNLNNVIEGDAGMIKLIVDNTGGYTVTLGNMFVEQLGETDLVLTANTINYISYRGYGTQEIESVEVPAIVYTINQVKT